MLHFADLFNQIADAVPDDLALLHGDRTLTWGEFRNQAERFATWLQNVGVGPGDRVGLLLYNGPEYLIAHYGAFLCRAIPVNINYRYLADEVAYLCSDSGAKVVVAHASLADRVPATTHLVIVDDETKGDGSWWQAINRVADYLPQAFSEDDVYMLYTGGTTGMPKGVMFRMGDFVHRMFTGYAYRGWEVPTAETLVEQVLSHRAAGDRRVSIPACPLMHGTGMWLGAIYAHLMGGCVVTLPGRSFDADELWGTAQQHGADSVTIVGDAFARPMLDALDRAEASGRPYDLRALRIIQSSGVMWSAEVQTGLLRHLDVRLVDSMGSTEGGMARRIVSRGTPIETASFEPLAGTKLVADDGTIVPKGSTERGRIAASAVVPIGYFNDPEKSAATFVEIDGVRHALAGDWAVWSPQGTLVLLGRGSNCINTAGEKVYPEEVEEAIKRHPLVTDCLVVGLRDERFHERVAAVVSVSTPITGEALLAEIKQWLSSYKLPRTLMIVGEVRRAPNGKADYGWARQTLEGANG